MSDPENPNTQDVLVERGLHCIRRLPIARAAGRLMKPAHLRDLLRFVQAYINSATTKTPPKKAYLYAAVQALLPEGTTLSPKWDKTQLALVLKKWCLTALKLSPFAAQPSLFVRVRASSSNAKRISHTCFINEEEDKVLTFAMQSPSPVKERPLTVGDLSSTVNSSGPAESGDFGGETYDEEFLREIDGLALDASIGEDVIPTLFYTPRVPGETVSSESSGNLRSSQDGSRDDTTGSPVRRAVLGQFRGLCVHASMTRYLIPQNTCISQRPANELRMPQCPQGQQRTSNPRRPARSRRTNRQKNTPKRRVRGQIPTPKLATNRVVRSIDRLQFLAQEYIVPH